MWRVDSNYQLRQHEAVFWPTRLEPTSSSDKPKRGGQTKRIPAVVLSGEDFTYNLKGLSNNTYYNVVIRSQNKFGWSPYSKSFTFQTLDKEKASMKLQNKQEIALFKGEGPLKSEPVVSCASVTRCNILPAVLLVITAHLLQVSRLLCSPDIANTCSRSYPLLTCLRKTRKN